MATYNVYEYDIAGAVGQMQAEPRVFAHSAKSVTIPTGATAEEKIFTSDNVPAPLPSGDDVQYTTIKRGACLYVGNTGNVKVRMESGDVVTFYGVVSGSFLPVLVLGIFGENENTETDGTSATNILALY
jgi:hypothetical protein